jgi:arylsulfatase A-like enzyme
MRILYLDIDTLRPDHLGCYGYHRETSPNIDKLAGEGVILNNCYCSDAPCLPSRNALMSGRFGIHTGVVNHGGTCADPRPEGKAREFESKAGNSTLPATLAKVAGLHTVYIGGFGDRHSAWQFYAGFREIHDTGKRGMESAEEVSPTALDWIERNGKKENWYLHINYWDPHTPFRAPPEFGNPFENTPLPEWYTPDLIHQHHKLAGPHTIQDINMYDNATSSVYPRQPGEVQNMDEMRQLIDGYDCGIRYADDHVGLILSALKKQGVLDDTIIILSADHGENYGELGLYAEHATADQGTCLIPMIIRWPGAQRGITDSALHYNLDLLPTLADMLEIPPSDLWDGQSFAPTLRNGTPCGREFLVLSQCAHVCQRAVRWQDYIWIRTWHDGFHLFDLEMLFNLRQDPYETENLAEQSQDLCRKAADMYHNWHHRMMQTLPEPWEDPLDTVLNEGGPHHAKGMIRATQYEQRLRETGREDSIPELRRRHPSEFTPQTDGSN